MPAKHITAPLRNFKCFLLYLFSHSMESTWKRRTAKVRRPWWSPEKPGAKAAWIFCSNTDAPTKRPPPPLPPPPPRRSSPVAPALPAWAGPAPGSGCRSPDVPDGRPEVHDGTKQCNGEKDRKKNSYWRLNNISNNVKAIFIRWVDH